MFPVFILIISTSAHSAINFPDKVGQMHWPKYKSQGTKIASGVVVFAGGLNSRGDSGSNVRHDI